MDWRVVKYSDGILTTYRGYGRYEDFLWTEGTDEVMAMKHFGDGDYDSGCCVELQEVDRDVLVNAINAAIRFHTDLDA